MLIIQILIPKENENQKLENLNILLSLIYGILAIFFMIVGSILIHMSNNNRDKINKYKDSIRWYQAFQYILYRREIEGKPVENKKYSLKKLVYNILEKIVK